MPFKDYDSRLRVYTKISSRNRTNFNESFSSIFTLLDTGCSHSTISIHSLQIQLQQDINLFKDNPHRPNLHNFKLYKHVTTTTVHEERIANNCISLTTFIDFGGWKDEIDWLVVEELNAEKAIIGAIFFLGINASSTLATSKFFFQNLKNVLQYVGLKRLYQYLKTRKWY